MQIIPKVFECFKFQDIAMGIFFDVEDTFYYFKHNRFGKRNCLKKLKGES